MLNSQLNCVQRCFIKGRKNSGCCESCADSFLLMPNCMWSHAGFYQSCIDTYTCKGLCAPCGCLALYTGYIFGSLLATPFILIGGTIKLCILGCDEPAAAHNRQEEKTYIE